MVILLQAVLEILLEVLGHLPIRIDLMKEIPVQEAQTLFSGEVGVAKSPMTLLTTGIEVELPILRRVTITS